MDGRAVKRWEPAADDPLWLAVYVEARAAFPTDVWLTTVSDDRRGVAMGAYKWFDREKLALTFVVGAHYAQSEGHDMIRHVARDAAERWEHEVARREPSQPFDLGRILTHADRRLRFARETTPVVVNNAWGGDMLMRLEDNRIVVSPAGYHAIMLDVSPPRVVFDRHGEAAIGADPYGFYRSPFAFAHS